MNQKCTHCGDACLNDKITLEDKIFCCSGCKTVFEILNQEGLGNYYNIESTPGISQKNVSKKNFDYIENPKVKEAIYEFSDGETSRIRIYLPSIHCSSCIWLLENLHKLSSGVVQCRVDFVKKQAAIVFKESEINLQDLLSLLDKIGYTPDLINSIEVKKTRTQSSKHSKALIYKIGIAGFSFGNIMLLSLPEYLDTLKEISKVYTNFFGYLSFFFVLPVVFYSAKDYFISAYKSIRSRYLNIDVPISIGIVTLFLRSSIDVFYFQEVAYFDSLAGLVFFLLIGKWFQEKTYNALSFDRDFKSFFPLAFKIETESTAVFKTLEEIEVNDVAIIRNGEVIPADAILLSNTARIDYSFVTGESLPVTRKENEEIFAGGQIVGESTRIKITKEVSNSYLIKLWNENDKNNEHKLLHLIDKISRNFTIAILTIALVSGLYWGVTTDWYTAINIFSAVLIVACPCALALAAPFTFGHAIRFLGKKDVFFKNTNVLESLAKTTAIVFDKTGTLTDASKADVSIEKTTGFKINEAEIAQIVQNSTHPLSVLLASYFGHQKSESSLEFFKEHIGKGLEATVDGSNYLLGSYKYLRENEISFAESSVRNPKVYLAINGEYKACFIFKNKYREGVLNQIVQLKTQFKIFILSGDNDYEKEALESYLGKSVEILFNQSPFDKKNFIAKLQNQGEVVAMFGDGLNDSGALLQCDNGISIIENIGSFSPASDIIIKASRIKQIKDLFQFSKSSVVLLKLSLVFSLLYNIVGMSFAVTGNLTPLVAAILMPLSSISVVGFVTLGISLIAKKLN